MEFNYAGQGEWNPTAQEMIERKYSNAGYKLPKVVYWNLAARNDNNPVKFDKRGTSLVSGFSPSLLTNLLAGKDLTPYALMMDVINGERYAPIEV